MEKLDLKKSLKFLYQPSAKEVVQVDVPPMKYLMIDGQGDPNTSPWSFLGRRADHRESASVY
jgi:hypothetical protein